MIKYARPLRLLLLLTNTSLTDFDYPTMSRQVSISSLPFSSRSRSPLTSSTAPSNTAFPVSTVTSDGVATPCSGHS
ncbi:6544_t:CDS:1, partial [Acaulospora colombiana]